MSFLQELVQFSLGELLQRTKDKRAAVVIRKQVFREVPRIAEQARQLEIERAEQQRAEELQAVHQVKHAVRSSSGHILQLDDSILNLGGNWSKSGFLEPPQSGTR